MNFEDALYNPNEILVLRANTEITKGLLEQIKGKQTAGLKVVPASELESATIDKLVFPQRRYDIFVQGEPLWVLASRNSGVTFGGLNGRSYASKLNPEDGALIFLKRVYETFTLHRLNGI